MIMIIHIKIFVGYPVCSQITGSALALHCWPMQKSIGKSKIRHPCKIVTHEDFNLKLGARDYVVDITHRATFGTNRLIRGFPQIREI